MCWTTRNRHKSGSSPSLNYKVEIQNSDSAGTGHWCHPAARRTFHWGRRMVRTRYGDDRVKRRKEMMNEVKPKSRWGQTKKEPTRCGHSELTERRKRPSVHELSGVRYQLFGCGKARMRRKAERERTAKDFPSTSKTFPYPGVLYFLCDSRRSVTVPVLKLVRVFSQILLLWSILWSIL